MDTSTASNGYVGFFDNLPFRPEHAVKRQRDTPPTHDNARTGEPESFEDLAARLQQASPTEPSHETQPDTKKRRLNDPGDEIEADQSQAVVTSDDLNAAATPPMNVDDLTVNSLNLNGTVAQRVARRRRGPVDPFIPKKPLYKKALVRRKPAPAPVFGMASLMTADEAKLVTALGRKVPQTRMATTSDNLPVPDLDPQNEDVHMNDHERMNVVPGEATLMDGEGSKNVVVDQDTHCLCKQPSDDAMVACTSCTKAFHPFCVGKGRQSYADYHDVRLVARMQTRASVASANLRVESSPRERRLQARLDDAKFYNEKGGFTCSLCDARAAKKASADTQFLPEEHKVEGRRRNKVFTARYGDKDSDKDLRDCDNCNEQIISIRYECNFCEHFDLCRVCFFDPKRSAKHQHAAGDMKLK